MGREKTIGNYKLTEFLAISSINGESGETKNFVLVHDLCWENPMRGVVDIPVDCLLIGHTLDEFEYEDDIIEVISMECLEALN